MIDSEKYRDESLEDTNSTQPFDGQGVDNRQVDAKTGDSSGPVMEQSAQQPPVYQRPPEMTYEQSAPYKPYQPTSQQSPYRYVHATAPEEDPHSKKKRTRMIVGLTALFLSVTIVLTALTAAVVYRVANRDRDTAGTTTNTTVTASSGGQFGRPNQTTAPTSGQTTTPGGQTQATTAVSGNATDKHFSLQDAASKQADGKTTLSIMQIAALAKPAVVAISTETKVFNPFGQSGIVPAAGSGFIITANGYIVTNYHVIEGAQSITAALDDGQIYKAVVVGSDQRNDLAVLKIDGTNLPTVVLGNSSELEVGELAVAIGNPLGELSGTVTAGIISALDREVTIDGITMNLLQTDAAINSGNSGGALINSFGEVIGINNAKNAGTGIEGLGFAIPIDTAKPIIESLIRHGYVAGRPKIGIGTRDISAEMAQYYNVPEGIYVSSVESDSAADIAGIQVGDVIIGADGQEALTTDALNDLKSNHQVGDRMTITFIREGKEMTAELILKEDLPAEIRPASYRESNGNVV